MPVHIIVRGRRDGGSWTPYSIRRFFLQLFLYAIWKGGSIKLFAGVLAFSVIVVIISALITKRRDKMDAAEVATYVVIIAWGALLWGLFLSKCAR
jgi:hypothetical protein